MRQAALRYVMLRFLCRVIAYKIETLLSIRDYEFQGMGYIIVIKIKIGKEVNKVEKHKTLPKH